MIPDIYFFREGPITQAEQKCIASFERFGHPTRVMNRADVLAQKHILNVPPEYEELGRQLDELPDDAPPSRRGALCSALSNWTKWIILSAPPQWDNAEFRIFPDTDFYAFTDPATWPAVIDVTKNVFINSHDKTVTTALIALMAGTPAHPFFVNTLRYAPGYHMGNTHIPVHLQSGSPLLIRSLVMQQPTDAEFACRRYSTLMAPLAAMGARRPLTTK